MDPALHGRVFRTQANGIESVPAKRSPDSLVSPRPHRHRPEILADRFLGALLYAATKFRDANSAMAASASIIMRVTSGGGSQLGGNVAHDRGHAILIVHQELGFNTHTNLPEPRQGGARYADVA